VPRAFDLGKPGRGCLVALMAGGLAGMFSCVFGLEIGGLFGRWLRVSGLSAGGVLGLLI
jgi:hypothetical protein